MAMFNRVAKKPQKVNAKNASKSCDLLKKRKELRKRIFQNMIS